jgi:hypothetical protein
VLQVVANLVRPSTTPVWETAVRLSSTILRHAAQQRQSSRHTATTHDRLASPARLGRERWEMYKECEFCIPTSQHQPPAVSYKSNAHPQNRILHQPNFSLAYRSSTKMYTPILFTLLAASALAFPTPQSFLSGIPGLFMTPNQYTTPGCAGGAPGCPTWEEWQRIQGKKANKPLTGESSVEEDNGHSLAIRQKRTEDEAGVSAEAIPSIFPSIEWVGRGLERVLT